LGVGYKIGNGLGFVGGDVVVRVVDHLSLDLQANYASVAVESGGQATGFGLAPGVQGELFARGSTPYLGTGPLYIRMTWEGLVASGWGFFANVGWHWKWSNGLGILLGAGVGHLASIQATDGIRTVRASGGTHFNIESGLRYMFF
jgi:hypothetical protein